MNKFKELYEKIIIEASKNKGVGTKDWDRMLLLVLKDNDGASIAKKLKNKDKAIARYVAGVKLEGTPSNWEPFTDFKEKALELGATEEEIETLLGQTEIPEKIKLKLVTLKTKKYGNRFVGDISKAVIDANFDINYMKHNGYAITHIGKDAMTHNGRKWTIGYKTEIDLGDRKIKFDFDAITDEGNGPTYYIVDRIESDNAFYDLTHGELGKNKFIKQLKEILVNIK